MITSFLYLQLSFSLLQEVDHQKEDGLILYSLQQLESSVSDKNYSQLLNGALSSLFSTKQNLFSIRIWYTSARKSPINLLGPFLSKYSVRLSVFRKG